MQSDKEPQTNSITINDLNNEEQAVYQRFTDILTQEYDAEDPNMRWSYIGQLLINSGNY